MQEGMSVYSLTQTLSLAQFCRSLYFYFLFQLLQTTGKSHERGKLNTVQEYLLTLQLKNCPDFCMWVGMCMGVVSYKLCYQYKD